MNEFETDNAQLAFARLAGLLFIVEIVLALSSGLVLSHILGSGDFAETGKRVAASEHLYRAALSLVLVVTLCSAVLAFALYATLRPVNQMLAQLAMIFSLGDSFLALVVRTGNFVRVNLYTSAQEVGPGAISVERLSDLMHSISGTAENIGGICFGIGSLLFFYLFFKSNYIPRMLSALGVAASFVWTSLYFATLVFPERHSLFQNICLGPMALSDVATGFYLLLFAVRARPYRDHAAAPMVAT